MHALRDATAGLSIFGFPNQIAQVNRRSVILFFLGLFQALMTAFILMKKANKRPADIFLMMLVICFSLHFLASFLLYELVSNTYFRKGFMNFTLA